MKYKNVSIFDAYDDDYKKNKKLISNDDGKIYLIIQESDDMILWLKDENGVSDLIHKCYINKRYKKYIDKH